jgi:RHS repeat-associated protein
LDTLQKSRSSWNGGAWTLTNEVHYVYDGYLLVQERDTNSNPLVTYTRGLDLSGSLHGAGGIGGLLARTDTNGSTFYHADGNGNITALMDTNQNIVARYLYGPFGKLVGQWGSMAALNEMQFSSMLVHDGLAFYPFRAYEPNLQRWLNRDPIGELGGLNLYRFVRNNPLKHLDAFGLQEPVPEREFDGDPGESVFVFGPQIPSDPLQQLQQDEQNMEDAYRSPDSEESQGANSPPSQVEGQGTLTEPPTQDDVDQLEKQLEKDQKNEDKDKAQKPCPKEAKQFSPAKQALAAMAKADKRTGMTPQDMQAYKDLNKELPDPFPEQTVRGPESHPDAASPSSQQPHGHVGNIGHIPVN